MSDAIAPSPGSPLPASESGTTPVPGLIVPGSYSPGLGGSGAATPGGSGAATSSAFVAGPIVLNGADQTLATVSYTLLPGQRVTILSSVEYQSTGGAGGVVTQKLSGGPGDQVAPTYATGEDIVVSRVRSNGGSPGSYTETLTARETGGGAQAQNISLVALVTG